MVRSAEATLRTLARSYGVQLSYVDLTGRRQSASTEALLSVVRALGAPLHRVDDAADALRERRLAAARRPVEPVVTAWDGSVTRLPLRLSAAAAGRVDCTLTLESGEERSWPVDLDALRTVGDDHVEGERYVTKELALPDPLPTGYHQLRIELGGRAHEARIIAAPTRCHEGSHDRAWGVFLPLYALQTERSWGAGDLTDLGALAEWVGDLGGSVIAVLPLLSSFLDEPCEPSPYAPVSRLFWNEMYIDPRDVPELERCPEAQSALEGTPLTAEVARLRQASHVDHRRLMALKRRVLEPCARALFAEPGERQAVFRRFVDARPEVEDYARFRATDERQPSSWHTWPKTVRAGRLQGGDLDEDARRYHLYVQWVAEEQMAALAQRAGARGVRLYLDLPLGVHPDGYDAWRHADAFAQGVSGGAPPDPFFRRGQDWGFPPLHPERIREEGHAYFINAIRHHLRHAGVLRIDHVMGLHRLFWVPHGMAAPEGVYVRYPAEELYAILSVESHRHRVAIVGEDLGTVPPYVRQTMARHGVLRLHVVQFELDPSAEQPLRPAPAAAVASVNTHDMPTFAAFWNGLDLADRVDLGLLTKPEAREEAEARRRLRASLARELRRRKRLAPNSEDAAAALRACLAELAAGQGRVVLATLEDLWGETQPQNVPGTSSERPNWRRKAKYDMETMQGMPEVTGTLSEIDRLRKEGRPQND